MLLIDNRRSFSGMISVNGMLHFALAHVCSLKQTTISSSYSSLTKCPIDSSNGAVNGTDFSQWSACKQSLWLRSDITHNTTTQIQICFKQALGSGDTRVNLQVCAQDQSVRGYNRYHVSQSTSLHDKHLLWVSTVSQCGGGFPPYWSGTVRQNNLFKGATEVSWQQVQHCSLYSRRAETWMSHSPSFSLPPNCL